jgi:SWI/SNF-related matrix-associated actin-dependent regulator 1 of chromatin subfamily A
LTPGPTLSPYQASAIDEIAGNDAMPHRYLADEQGLGKTIEALCILIRWTVRVAMIVCPASAIGVWRREATLWWPEATVLTPRGDLDLRALNLRGSTLRDHYAVCLIVLSYDMLSRAANAWVRLARAFKLDALVCDEAHRLKHRSLRTRAVFGPGCDTRDSLTEHVPHVLLLSGTPMTSYHADLWPALHALWPERLWYGASHRVPMSQHAYEDHFCVLRDDGFGPRPVANRNTDELRKRLQGNGRPIFIRRTKLDVLKDLPPVRLVLTPLDLPPPDQALPDTILDTLTDEQLSAWVTANTVSHASDRRLLGEYKLPAIVPWVTDWLDDNPDDKLIVFAVHRRVLDTLFAALHNAGHRPVLLDGRTRSQDRDSLVARFQNEPTCRVFVGQLLAAGEAITLHAASTVCFAETDWSHTAIVQALSRAHRRGQRRAVLGHVLVVPDSMDERIHGVAVRKAAGIVALWGGFNNDDRVDDSRGDDGRVEGSAGQVVAGEHAGGADPSPAG